MNCDRDILSGTIQYKFENLFTDGIESCHKSSAGKLYNFTRDSNPQNCQRSFPVLKI